MTHVRCSLCYAIASFRWLHILLAFYLTNPARSTS